MTNKNPSLLFGTTICFCLLVLLSSCVVEAQRAGYPPVNMPPPPVASWTALVDTSKLPNAPVRKVGDSCDVADPYCVWPCYNCLRTNDTDIGACPQKTDWGLSYDDGPTNNTGVVLDKLKSKGLKATFFVIGSSVVNDPDMLVRVVKEGHQVGVHTWSHTPLTTQTTDVIIAEIKWTEKIIKEVAGVTPLYMRPPGGDLDDRVRGIMKQLGYTVTMWNRDTFDWTSNSPNSTYDLNWIEGNFTMWANDKNLTTGIISLEHDAFTKTASRAPKAIDIVTSAGFNVKPVANCIGKNAFYVESSNSTTTSNSTSNSTSTSGNQKSSATTTIIHNIFIITTCIFIRNSAMICMPVTVPTPFTPSV